VGCHRVRQRPNTAVVHHAARRHDQQVTLRRPVPGPRCFTPRCEHLHPRVFLLACLCRKSGGNMGAELISSFRRLLHPLQVGGRCCVCC
jgi:hypothetical protein